MFWILFGLGGGVLVGSVWDGSGSVWDVFGGIFCMFVLVEFSVVFVDLGGGGGGVCCYCGGSGLFCRGLIIVHLSIAVVCR